ncbi:DoxX family protein [Brevibacillus humidisoli]|uniref:DoxX family protein n=1 Tax=Brevibacillus humidisoli TaxID=2895522 RepID=UPI001E2CED54|nr:DoxX family protein [Brevibacillus humidisoli]UFJ40847.1 DoxX family protein [Brevibacillus humidisoli]
MTKEQAASTIVRVVLGIIFFAHGLDKFNNGLENIAGWFASIGLPGFVAYLVAIIELVGGIALIIGLGTRYVSILTAIIMLGAIGKVKLANGLLGGGQGAGFELDLALLAMSVYLALTDTKALSVDQLFQRSKTTAA